MLGWMRRYLGIGVAWVGATLLSVAIASAAVAGIRDRVVETPVAIGLPTTTTTLPADAGPATSIPGSTTSVAPETTAATVVPTPTEPPAVTTTTVPGVTTTTVPPVTTATTAPPATTTTTTTTPVTYQTYDLEGGIVVLAVGDGVVTLVSATPRPGFRAEFENQGPDEVDVKFESNDHKSKLDAKWEDGELKVDTKEESGDDDGSDSADD